jgi:hypothetical protein
MAVDVEMCMMVLELRVRERQLAEKARDIKVRSLCYEPKKEAQGLTWCVGSSNLDSCSLANIVHRNPRAPIPHRHPPRSPTDRTGRSIPTIVNGCRRRERFSETRYQNGTTCHEDSGSRGTVNAELVWEIERACAVR